MQAYGIDSMKRFPGKTSLPCRYNKKYKIWWQIDFNHISKTSERQKAKTQIRKEKIYEYDISKPWDE